VVQYSNNLIQDLERSLGYAFHQRFLRLTRPPGTRQRPSEFHIRLDVDSRGSPVTTALEDDGSEPLVMEIMLPGGRHSSFWFSFVAAFRQEQSEKHSLQHASLPVFHNIVGELVPLFRAEWDQLAASCTNSTHAQPHWHFVQRPARIESIVLQHMGASTVRDFVPEETSEFLPGLVDCGRFHFAMTSLWEKTDEPGYVKRTFDTDDFPRWFENLTNYIAGQIDYLVSHMPETFGAGI
jgi:hypothetical protein